MCYATKIGRALIGPMERMETMESNILSSNPEEFPSYTPFQPNVKRKRIEDEEHAVGKNQPIMDSDQSDDETIDNDKRYNIEGSISTSTLNNSPNQDDPDHISSHLSSLLDGCFRVKL
ncbi:unnamed protein product [Rotaria magnacalcarata]|nr:unnamed protein product [Rotaria magnacalcarata]